MTPTPAVIFGLTTTITAPWILTLSAALTENRTWILPDRSDTFAGLGAQTFTGAQTIQATLGLTVRRAATQDGVALVGRAGGTGDYIASITTAALGAPRTWTLPDRSDTVAGLGAQEFTGAQQFPAGSATVPSVALGVATDGFGRFATGIVSLLIASQERVRLQADRLLIKANAEAWYAPGIPNLGLHGLTFYGADGTACGLGASTVANDTRFIGRRANGTALVPTALAAGDDILNIQASGYDGTAFTADRARITAEVAEAWSATAHGTRWRFYTTAAGATALSEAFQLNSTGQALVSSGTAALPGQAFISDADTGAFLVAANTYGIACGGVERFRFSASALTVNGNAVGIGTAPITVSAGLNFYAADGSTAGVFATSFGNYSATYWRRANGSAAAMTGLTAGDPIGALLVSGVQADDLTALVSGKLAHRISAAETWGSTALGFYQSWFTIAAATATATEKLRLHASGGLTLGGTLTVDPGAGCLVLGGTTASTSTTTGALIVGGGLGIAGAIWSDSHTITSTADGALTVAGRITAKVAVPASFADEAAVQSYLASILT